MKKFTPIVLSLALAALSVNVSAQSIQSKFKFSTPDFDSTDLLQRKNEIDFDPVSETNRSAAGSLFKTVSPSVVKILTNEGSGSGVVLSRKGFILTNYHVIEGYGSVGVVMVTDSKSEKVRIAEVVRINQIADLALIKLPEGTPGLTPVRTAKNSPEVGDDVHAIGHPLGEDWTYTRGYISQIRKDYSWQTSATDHHVANVIQTQTPINPGNSGGPLLNDNGELIGINSFVNSRAEGLNYAIDLSTVGQFLKSKANVVRKVISLDNDDLIDSGDLNKNGNPDIYVWDKNRNRKGDMIGLDKDEDLSIEVVLLDKNENGTPEVRIEPSNLPDIPGVLYFFDKDEDGKDDAIGVDLDSDGQIDEVVPLD